MEGRRVWGDIFLLNLPDVSGEISGGLLLSESDGDITGWNDDNE
jgi:hypothetical protein